MLPWTFVYEFLCRLLFSFLLAIYLEVGFLGHMRTLPWRFRGSVKPSSKGVAPIDVPSSNVWVSQFLHPRQPWFWEQTLTRSTSCCIPDFSTHPQENIPVSSFSGLSVKRKTSPLGRMHYTSGTSCRIFGDTEAPAEVSIRFCWSIPTLLPSDTHISTENALFNEPAGVGSH